MDRDQVYEQLRARIVRWATSSVGRDRAEDLAQEVLVVLSEKYSDREDLKELLRIAFTTLNNKILNANRRRARWKTNQDVPIETFLLTPAATNPGLQESDPQEWVVRREMRGHLRTAITRLRPPCQELFRLELQGHSLKEIIEILGAPAGTIYARHFRCLEALKKEARKLLGQPGKV